MAKQVPASSSLNLYPTARQALAVTRLCAQLGITEALENTPSNRLEARALIYRLRQQRESLRKGGNK